MWFRFCYSCVLFLLSNITLVINDNVDKKQNKNQENPIFSELIKNMSRVDNNLQELIDNYKHKLNLYKSRSFGAVDISTESEIDERFKHAVSPSKSRITQMTSFEEEDSEAEKLYHSNIGNSRSKHTVVMESLRIRKPNKANKDSTSSSIETYKSHESDPKDSYKNHENVFREETDSLSIMPRYNDAENNRSPEKENPRDPIIAKTDINNKSKFNTKLDESDQTRSSLKGDKVNKEYSSETNSGALIDHSSESFQSPHISPKTNMDSMPFRIKLNEPRPKVSEYKRNNYRHHEHSDEVKVPYYVFYDNVMSSKIPTKSRDINKEMPTNDLREAYGNACMKLVVRKCFVACKKVIKMVCNYNKCSSAFKEKFIDHSKTGCIQQFRPVTNTEPVMKFNRPDDSNEDWMSRSGLEGCYPILASETTLNTTTYPTQPGELQLNILRNRYEKACQKESASRCNRSCKDAYTAACSDGSKECSNRLLKSFTTTCSRQCKIAYTNKKTDKKGRSSSDSDSSSDSSSLSSS